jgi:hypothetical protein
MTNPFRRKDSGSGIPANFTSDDDFTQLDELKTQNPIRVEFPQSPITSHQQEPSSRDGERPETDDIVSTTAKEKPDNPTKQELISRPNLSNNNQSGEEHESSELSANPLTQTVVTLEAADYTPEIASEATISSQSRDKLRASRALDVNSFKKLLLTGNSTSVVPDSVSKWKGANPSDSTSSTETSSISRQSLLENVAESSGETPRSSYDRPWPDEILKGKMDRNKPPPPPPKSKHGKSLLPKGPQTVSFDDFSPTIPSESPSRNSLVSDPFPVGAMFSTNKPLPSPPIASTRQISETNLPEANGDGIDQIPTASQKKTAPPPPLARRSTITKRPRGNTTSSITSVTEEGSSSYPPSITDSTLPQKALPPPPPPSRRSGSATNIQSPLASQDPTKDGPLDTKSPPITNRTRSSSQASVLSPPPPPPTRRRSSRASVETAPKFSGSASQSRRSSTEIVRSSLDSQRRISSGQQDQPIFEEEDNVEPSNELPQIKPSSGKDILADMDAFAKELEQLRNQYGGD